MRLLARRMGAWLQANQYHMLVSAVGRMDERIRNDMVLPKKRRRLADGSGNRPSDRGGSESVVADTK